MTLFQILAAFFGLWMLYTIFIYAKKRIVSKTELSLWVSLWCLFIVIALFPNLLLGISHQLRFSRVFDLLVVGAFIILTVMIFISYFAQKENNRKLQQLIQELSIKEAIKQPRRTKRS